MARLWLYEKDIVHACATIEASCFIEPGFLFLWCCFLFREICWRCGGAEDAMGRRREAGRKQGEGEESMLRRVGTNGVVESQADCMILFVVCGCH